MRYLDEKLNMVKKNYEFIFNNQQKNILRTGNVNNHKRVLRERKYLGLVLKESQDCFPHLTKDYINQNLDLFKHIQRNISIGKSIIKECKIKNVNTKNSILRRWALTGYAEYYLKISESLDDFVEKADENLLKVFPTKIKKHSVLNERTSAAATDDAKTQNTTFRIEYTPSLKIDPEDKDPESIHSLLYWDRIAKEEPDAPDIQEYKNRRWLHAMGVDGDLLEDPMFKSDETMFHPKVLQKLRDRSRFEQKMRSRGMDGEQLEQALANFDKENKIEKIIQIIKRKQENRQENRQETNEKPEEKKKSGFFRSIFNRAGSAISSVVGGIRDAAKYPSEVVQTIQKNVSKWIAQAKEWLENHPLAKRSINTLLLIGFACIIGYFASLGGIIGLTASIVQTVLSALGVVKSSKSLIDLFKEMSGNKTGWEGVRAVIDSFENKKYLIQFLIVIITLALSLFSFMSSLKSLSSNLHKLAAEYGIKVGSDVYNPRGAPPVERVSQATRGADQAAAPITQTPPAATPTAQPAAPRAEDAASLQRAAGQIQELAFQPEKTKDTLNSVLKYLSDNSESIRQDPQTAQQIADYALKKMSDNLTKQYGAEILDASINNPMFQGVFGRGTNVTVNDALRYMVYSALKMRPPPSFG